MDLQDAIKDKAIMEREIAQMLQIYSDLYGLDIVAVEVSQLDIGAVYGETVTTREGLRYKVWIKAQL